MKKNRRTGPEEKRKKEDRMRPSRFLGYDHNNIAIHLFKMGTYEIAENEVRRAIWLNPYEIRFKINLAWFLCKLKKTGEAEDLVLTILKESPDNTEAKKIMEFIDQQKKE